MLIKAKQIIRESWEMYRKNFLLFFRAILWLLIPSLAVAAIERIIGAYIKTLPWLWPTVVFLLFSFILFILSIWISIVVINLCNKLYYKQAIRLKSIYQSSAKQFFDYLWISILIGLIVFLGGLAFVVPGLIFGVWLSFALMIVIIEDAKGAKVLLMSKEMVDGRFWPIVWRWFAPAVAFFAPMIAILVIIELALDYFILGNAFSTASPWWFALIENSASLVFFAPLFTAVGVILYNELKKENNVE